MGLEWNIYIYLKCAYLAVPMIFLLLAVLVSAVMLAPTSSSVSSSTSFCWTTKTQQLAAAKKRADHKITWKIFLVCCVVCVCVCIQLFPCPFCLWARLPLSQCLYTAANTNNSEREMRWDINLKKKRLFVSSLHLQSVFAFSIRPMRHTENKIQKKNNWRE